MPQFDIVVYSNELIWVFILFFLIYSFNYLFFFPRVAEILKVRKKKVEQDLISLELLDSTINNLFINKEGVFFNSILNSSFKDFLSFCSIIGFFEQMGSLNYNLPIKYFLGGFYNFFDFYELDSV